MDLFNKCINQRACTLILSFVSNVQLYSKIMMTMRYTVSSTLISENKMSTAI